MFYKAQTINPLEYFQSSPKAVNALSFILSAILILWVFATPTFAAGVKAVEKKNIEYIQDAPKRLSEYSDRSITIIETLQNSSNLSKADKKALAKELKELQKLMKDEQSYIDESFNAMLDDIASKNLPDIFKERVVKMQEKYKGKKNKLNGVIDNIGSRYIDEQNIEPYDSSDINLTSYKKDTHQRFDPAQLPFELKKTKPTKPKTSQDEFISMGFVNNPLPSYAALGDFKYDTLAGASNPDYLATTDEIVITQAIADKAEELNYDPVQIYNFVRNNIEYIPTWGAVQSADLTLGAKRGNAMDISSLMIALFRASKIPARYVHGTITVDANKFKNWIGGFENIYTAINYASKGDIPIAPFPAEGGQISKIQMEHIWVEVATDYFPSRGAKNRVADSWVALDGSFKTYEYSKGIDVMAISGIDINSTVNSFIASGDINATQGWATGFDNTILEGALNDAQVNIKEYIDVNYDLNKTSLYDIIGGKRVIKAETNILPNTLPFISSIVGARYAKIPSSLQQKMEFYIAGTTQEFAINEFMNGKKIITLPMAKLNNEKVTLSFAPATSSDEAALNALLPEGNITDASQLPSSIPLYIHVKPQLKLNGEVIFELPETALGDKYTIAQKLYRPNQTLGFGQPRELIAGGFYSVNTIVQSISITKLKNLQDKIKSTHDTLLSNDINQISLLTREDIMGDMVYAGTLSYYAQMIAKGKLTARSLDSRFELAGSSGVIGYKPNVDKLFGMPIKLTAGGMSCDLIDTHMVETTHNEIAKHIQTNKSLGVIGSSLEHLVLEQLFATNGEQGFSAVKAMQVANQEGQKIFTITQDNYQEIIPQLNLAPAAITDIESAAKAGYTVTTHQNRISLNGYTGEGYIILNSTGNGAWMINGGRYGGDFGFLNPVQAGQMTFMSILNGMANEFNTKFINDRFIGNIFNSFAKLFSLLGIANNVTTLQDMSCDSSFIAAYLAYETIMHVLLDFIIVNPLIAILTMAFAIVMQDLLMLYLSTQCRIRQI